MTQQHDLTQRLNDRHSPNDIHFHCPQALWADKKDRMKKNNQSIKTITKLHSQYDVLDILVPFPGCLSHTLAPRRTSPTWTSPPALPTCCPMARRSSWLWRRAPRTLLTWWLTSLLFKPIMPTSFASSPTTSRCQQKQRLGWFSLMFLYSWNEVLQKKQTLGMLACRYTRLLPTPYA